MPDKRTGGGSRAWRFRRCPSCEKVARASDFATINAFQAYWGHSDEEAQRECPYCGYEGGTSEFRVVRERHPESSKRSEAKKADTVQTYRDTEIPWACSRCHQFDDHDAFTLVDTRRVHREPCGEGVPASV